MILHAHFLGSMAQLFDGSAKNNCSEVCRRDFLIEQLLNTSSALNCDRFTEEVNPSDIFEGYTFAQGLYNSIVGFVALKEYKIVMHISDLTKPQHRASFPNLVVSVVFNFKLKPFLNRSIFCFYTSQRSTPL